jgi:prefoldin subunit 5
MEINKEYLEQEISLLQQQHASLVTNVHAVAGAIQAYQELLRKLEKKEETNG